MPQLCVKANVNNPSANQCFIVDERAMIYTDEAVRVCPQHSTIFSNIVTKQATINSNITDRRLTNNAPPKVLASFLMKKLPSVVIVLLESAYIAPLWPS